MTVSLVRNIDRRALGWSPLGDVPDLGAGDVPDLSCVPRRGPPARDGFPNDVRDRAYMAMALRGWANPTKETDGLTASLERIDMAVAQGGERIGSMTTLTRLFASSLTPYFFNSLTSGAHRVATQRALTLAYADALIQRARTGAWPTSSTVPDPLGEGTLGMRVDSDGRFRVWSVGDNGLNDGGLSPSELWDSRKSSDDLVAAYPLIPRHVSKRPPPSIRPPRWLAD